MFTTRSFVWRHVRMLSSSLMSMFSRGGSDCRHSTYLRYVLWGIELSNFCQLQRPLTTIEPFIARRLQNRIPNRSLLQLDLALKDGTKEGDTSSFIKNGEWELIGKKPSHRVCTRITQKKKQSRSNVRTSKACFLLHIFYLHRYL